VSGIAHDGQNLWALDSKNKRICMIEKAAPAEDNAAEQNVRHEGNRVWIEGVPVLSWDLSKMTTFCGALETAMAITEHPFSYSDLMGYSGIAFRTRWHHVSEKDRWCCSSIVGEQPDEYEAIVKATGWPLPTEIQFGQEDPDRAKIAMKIVASIDAGKPVVAYPDDLNMAVAFGYVDHGKTILFRDYSRGAEIHEVPQARLGPMQTYLGERGSGMSRKDAFLEGLRIAVGNWRLERRVDGPAEYWYGDAAYGVWLKDLENAHKLDEGGRGALFWLNILAFGTMCDARRAGIEFLRENAELLTEDACSAVDEAIDINQQHLELCDAAMKGEEGPGIWYCPSQEQWIDSDQRDGQRELLCRLRQLDASAITALEQATYSAE
jgi:hypothetical protein